MVKPTVELVAEIFDNEIYAKLAHANHKAYVTADPFPHMSIDDFLPPALAEILAIEFPRPGQKWTKHESLRVNRRFLGDETQYSPLFRAFARAISSRRFLLFLESLSGIEGLIPDPYFVGGGAMTAAAGHKLDMHLDFNWHYGLHCYRRLNALFYLTPGWQTNWGGDLRVSNEDKSIVKSYMPLFNRLIVFSTSEKSWHGQPVPLTCPVGISRNVFSAFYYTAASPEQEADPHLTKYQDETPYTAAPLKDFKNEGM